MWEDNGAIIRLKHRREMERTHEIRAYGAMFRICEARRSGPGAEWGLWDRLVRFYMGDRAENV